MNKITKVLITSFFTNIFLSVIKITAGIFGASGALIADGIHSLSDTATDIFGIVGHKLSEKPADYNHPFGHGKIEYITCIGVGFIVMLMGFTVIYKGIFEGVVIPSIYVLTVSVIVIIMKPLLASYILKKGSDYNNNILIASGNESFADVISSLVVLISILISQLGQINSLFMYADMLAMIIVGILILRISFKILKGNFSSLLGEQVLDEPYIEKIESIIKKEKDTKSIDKLIIIKYGNYYQVTCEISMDKNMKLEKVHNKIEKIENNLKKYDEKLRHITIHVNPYKD